MEGGWKTPPPPSATTRQKSPVLIGLIKKGTLPPGALPYWAVLDVFFKVSFFRENSSTLGKKFAKKILNRVGGGGGEA